MLSPYQAMGNDPVSGTDPQGTMTGQPGGNLPPPPGGAPPVLTSAFGALVSPVPAGSLWQVSIDGPLMGFSSAVLNDMAGGVNTDPMDLEGQMSGGGDLGAFVTAVLQAGGFLNVITGSQPVSSQIISNLIMAEGNGSGGGASDDAGGDKQDGSKNNYSEKTTSYSASTGAFLMVEGVGAQGGFSVSGAIQIKKSSSNGSYQVNITAVGEAPNASKSGTVKFAGSVDLIVNGRKTATHSFALPANEEILIPSGAFPLGGTSFDLPMSGKIELQINASYIFIGDEGRSVPIPSTVHDRELIYSN